MTDDLISRAYRKKPVTIEAVQWTGENLKEVLAFTGKYPSWSKWFPSFEAYEAHVHADRDVFKIMTLEGTMEASPGDWIIRGVKGEHYPCKPDIFEATYERALPAAQAQEPVAWRWHSRIKGGAWDAWENGRFGRPVPPFMEVEEQPLYAHPATPAPASTDNTALVEAAYAAGYGERRMSAPNHESVSTWAHVREGQTVSCGADHYNKKHPDYYKLVAEDRLRQLEHAGDNLKRIMAAYDRLFHDITSQSMFIAAYKEWHQL